MPSSASSIFTSKRLRFTANEEAITHGRSSTESERDTESVEFGDSNSDNDLPFVVSSPDSSSWGSEEGYPENMTSSMVKALLLEWNVWDPTSRPTEFDDDPATNTPTKIVIIFPGLPTVQISPSAENKPVTVGEVYDVIGAHLLERVNPNAQSRLGGISRSRQVELTRVDGLQGRPVLLSLTDSHDEYEQGVTHWKAVFKKPKES